MARGHGVFRSTPEAPSLKIRIDTESDALHLRLDESPIAESEEVHPGVILDFNDADQVVGVEILRARRRLPIADLKQVDFEVA